MMRALAWVQLNNWQWGCQVRYKGIVRRLRPGSARTTRRSLTKASSARWKRLERLFEFGVLAVGAAMALSLIVAEGRFQSAFDRDALRMAPQPQLSIVLLIAACIYVVLWFFAVSGEMEMLREYGEEFVPPLPDLRLQALGLSVLLALLVYFSEYPVVFSALFVSQKLMEAWAIGIRDSKIEESLMTARQQAPTDDRRRPAWNIIERYYLDRPQIQLAIAMSCLALAALVLSVCGETFADKRLFLSAAYLLLISTIAINEAIYFLWRQTRDDALGERYS